MARDDGRHSVTAAERDVLAVVWQAGPAGADLAAATRPTLGQVHSSAARRLERAGLLSIDAGARATLTDLGVEVTGAQDPGTFHPPRPADLPEPGEVEEPAPAEPETCRVVVAFLCHGGGKGSRLACGRRRPCPLDGHEAAHADYDARRATTGGAS